MTPAPLDLPLLPFYSFVHQIMGQQEEALRKQESGVPYTTLYPGA